MRLWMAAPHPTHAISLPLYPLSGEKAQMTHSSHSEHSLHFHQLVAATFVKSLRVLTFFSFSLL